MTEGQAKRLGLAFTKARSARDLSLKETMRQTGLDVAWLSRLEDGHYRDPDAMRVLRLAEFLGVDPARINKLTGGLVSEVLPGVRTYLRSTTPASDEDIAAIEKQIRRVLAKYGEVDLDSSTDPITTKRKLGGSS